MTPERFEALAEAYGGDVDRWPAAERDAARRWAATHPAEAETALLRANELDTWLDAAPAPRVKPALVERVIAGAPSGRRERRPAWWLPAGMGAGLAAACAAGVLVGLQFDESRPSEADAVVAAVSEGLALYPDDGA